MDLPQREAVIRYGDAQFQLREAGAFVTCAVTGIRIALDELRYWSVARQEAYSDAIAATEAERRHNS